MHVVFHFGWLGEIDEKMLDVLASHRDVRCSPVALRTRCKRVSERKWLVIRFTSFINLTPHPRPMFRSRHYSSLQPWRLSWPRLSVRLFLFLIKSQYHRLKREFKPYPFISSSRFLPFSSLLFPSIIVHGWHVYLLTSTQTEHFCPCSLLPLECLFHHHLRKGM